MFERFTLFTAIVIFLIGIFYAAQYSFELEFGSAFAILVSSIAASFFVLSKFNLENPVVKILSALTLFLGLSIPLVDAIHTINENEIQIDVAAQILNGEICSDKTTHEYRANLIGACMLEQYFVAGDLATNTSAAGKLDPLSGFFLDVKNVQRNEFSSLCTKKLKKIHKVCPLNHAHLQKKDKIALLKLIEN